MSFSLANPSTFTQYSFKRDDTHNGVWGLQRFLNSIGYMTVAPTGFFGEYTDEAVKRYQKAKNLVVDGVVGPKTQAIIVHSAVTRAPGGTAVPKNLVEGMIAGESGGLLGAVNASVAGGLDLGITQRRVYGPPYDPDKVAEALDPTFGVAQAIGELRSRYVTYSKRVGTGEYAWRLAALAHNWPYAADTLSKGGTLSTTKAATWAPASAKFVDGVDVYSWRDWAEFYALGSKKHNHAGLVTGLAFGVPAT